MKLKEKKYTFRLTPHRNQDESQDCLFWLLKYLDLIDHAKIIVRTILKYFLSARKCVILRFAPPLILYSPRIPPPNPSSPLFACTTSYSVSD